MCKTIFILCVCSLVSGGAGALWTWDVSADFVASPAGNPNPPWEYREVWDASDHPNYSQQLLTYATDTFTVTYSPGRHGYAKTGTPEQGSTGIMRVEGSDWNPGWGPAYVGEMAAGHALVRWTSPVNETVLISGYVRQMGFNDTRHHTWSIRKNNVTLTSGSLDAVGNHNFTGGSGGAGALTVSVVPGDKIDFLVRVNTGPATAAMWYAFEEIISIAENPGRQYTLTVGTDPSFISSVTPAPGQYVFNENVIVQLAANAGPFLCPVEYHFDHWEGEVENPNTASTRVFMDADKTVTAVYEEVTSAPWGTCNTSYRRAMIPPMTPDWVDNPFKDFDADEWADQLQAAGVDVVIMSAKQSGGDAYFPTQVGHYIGVDVFGPLTAALHARGLRIMAYINLNDWWILQEHPEWRMANGGGADPVNLEIPAARAYFLGLIEELVRDYPVDGLWFDLWQTGASFMYEIKAKIQEVAPSRADDIAITFNGAGIGGDELTGIVDILSTEAHDYRTCSRHAKVLRRWGKPFELQVPENLGGWITWRPRPGYSHRALGSLTIANGGTPCFGLLVSPDTGTLNQSFLDEMAQTWHWIEQCEPYILNMQSGAEVGVIMSTAAVSTWYHAPIGLHAALVDNHIPYDIVRPDADFSPYRVLVLTDKMILGPTEANRVRQFVSDGGKLLALHGSYSNLTDVLGIQADGTVIPAGYKACYIIDDGTGDPNVWKGINKSPICIRGATSGYLVQLNGGTALAPLTLPFDIDQVPTIYHGYNAPAETPTGYPAIVYNQYGSGEAVYVAVSLATEIETIQDFYYYSAPYHKKLLANLVGLLGGDELLETDVPSQVEINVGKKGESYLLFFMDCSPAMGDRFGPEISEAPKIRFKVSLPLDRLGEARHVRKIPEETEIPAKEKNGRLEFEAEVNVSSIYQVIDLPVTVKEHIPGDIAPPPNGDGVVDMRDFVLMAKHWLE